MFLVHGHKIDGQRCMRTFSSSLMYESKAGIAIRRITLYAFCKRKAILTLRAEWRIWVRALLCIQHPHDCFEDSSVL
jgi:hypothetical protein